MPAARNIACVEFEELARGELSDRSRSNSEARNQLREDVEAASTWIEARRAAHAHGLHDVYSNADCDPLEIPIAPSRLDQNSSQLPVRNVEIVRPLEPNGLGGKKIERARRAKSDSE
jgi:hypothetical protein